LNGALHCSDVTYTVPVLRAFLSCTKLLGVQTFARLISGYINRVTGMILSGL